MSDRKLIVVSGPTAVGKTAYAIELAKQLNSPIISADSRQVFQELNIGVARPSIEQLNQVEHHLIAHTSIHNPYNAGIYAQEARNLINELFETHKTLVVCGGTGLYIKALLSGFDPLPPSDEKLRLELEEKFSVYGIEYLQEKLRNLSIELYKKTENLNPQRLIRAIEIGSANEVPKNDIPDFNFEFETEYKILKMARPELYDRINKRVDEMIEIGLEKEAKDLEKSQNLNALQTVGYSEWWPYFRGENPLDFTVDKIKQHSRNYAKRQETWFKHQITKANASQ
jgi:tRNA dimethylallyltransferase